MKINIDVFKVFVSKFLFVVLVVVMIVLVILNIVVV